MSEDHRLLTTKFKDYDGALESGSFSAAGFRSTFENGAWWTFASLMMLATVCGSIWGYGAFSNVFREAGSGYMFTQTQIEMLAAFAVCGNYIVLDGGVIASRYGTEVGLILGVTMVAVGYFAIWLCVTVARVPFAILALCFFTYGHGCGLTDNAAVTGLLAAFPDHVGSVMGCYKSLYGLSTAILTVSAALLFESEPHKFILMLSIYAMSVGAVTVSIVHRTKAIVSETTSRVKAKLFYVACGIFIAATAVCLFSVRVNSMHLALKDAHKPLLILVFVCILAGFALLWSVVSSVKTDLSQSEEVMQCHSPTNAHRDMTVADMIRCIDFWLFFGMSIVGVGSCVMVVESAGQMLPAFEGSAASESVPAFVAVGSCFNCVGRVISGNVSEWLKDQVPRSYFYAAANFANVLAFSLLASVGTSMIWIATALILFSFGWLWGLMPAMVYDLFGSTDFSVKYAVIVLSGGVGALLFSSLLTGTVFDNEARRRHEFPFCYAPSCFEASFVVAACCNASAAFLGVLLCSRTRHVSEVNLSDKLN